MDLDDDEEEEEDQHQPMSPIQQKERPISSIIFFSKLCILNDKMT